MDSKNCSSKKCTANCIISVLAVFVFTFFYDMIVHGKLLLPFYQQTPNLWRSVPEMEQMLPWCLGVHFLIALVITCFFKKYKKYTAAACATTTAEEAKNCSSVSRGVCFGTHLGLIIGLGMFSSYIMLPISLELGAMWFATGFLKGFAVGVILGILSKKTA